MNRLEALQVERGMLLALAAGAPRGRPEIQARLLEVTTQLLRIELQPGPLVPVPEHPEEEGHELLYFQK